MTDQPLPTFKQKSKYLVLVWLEILDSFYCQIFDSFHPEYTNVISFTNIWRCFTGTYDLIA